MRFEDKPLTSGTVTILSADGKERFSAIGPDGRYSVLGVPTGAVRIGVKSHAKIPEGLVRKGEKQQMTKLPPRYEKAETSGLTTTVGGGHFKHDINLSAINEQ